MATAATSRELNPTREDFAALLSESLSKDDAFEGSVVRASSRRSRRISPSSSRPEDGRPRAVARSSRCPAKPADLKVGERWRSTSRRMENALGEAVLSREKARREESWTRLEEKFNAKEQVEGVIFNKVKGGFTVTSTAPWRSCPAARLTCAPCVTSDP